MQCWAGPSRPHEKEWQIESPDPLLPSGRPGGRTLTLLLVVVGISDGTASESLHLLVIHCYTAPCFLVPVFILLVLAGDLYIAEFEDLLT